jgi:hypothetical protein
MPLYNPDDSITPKYPGIVFVFRVIEPYVEGYDPKH